MVQCAVGRGDITLAFLRGKLEGTATRRARSVLDLVIPRADSLLEVLANTAFRRAGLQVRRHVEIPGVGEVDFLVEDCIVVETDGASHLEPLQVKKDRRRNNASLIGGYLVLRFGYDDVVHHPERMVAEVLAVLEQRRRGASGRDGRSQLPSGATLGAKAGDPGETTACPCQSAPGRRNPPGNQAASGTGSREAVEPSLRPRR